LAREAMGEAAMGSADAGGTIVEVMGRRIMVMASAWASARAHNSTRFFGFV